MQLVYINGVCITPKKAQLLCLGGEIELRLEFDENTEISMESEERPKKQQPKKQKTNFRTSRKCVIDGKPLKGAQRKFCKGHTSKEQDDYYKSNTTFDLCNFSKDEEEEEEK